jgi:beta-alanine--pyruvate transaminase
MMVSAEGMLSTDDRGRKIIGRRLSGLWCCGLGHSRPEITAAVAKQLGTRGLSPGASSTATACRLSWPTAIKELTPEGLTACSSPVRAPSPPTPR